MTRFASRLTGTMLAALTALAPHVSAAQDGAKGPLPEQRIELTAGFDMPGGERVFVFPEPCRSWWRTQRQGEGGTPAPA